MIQPNDVYNLTFTSFVKYKDHHNLTQVAHSNKEKWKVKHNCSKSQSDVGKEVVKRKAVT